MSMTHNDEDGGDPWDSSTWQGSLITTIDPRLLRKSVDSGCSMSDENSFWRRRRRGRTDRRRVRAQKRRRQKEYDEIYGKWNPTSFDHVYPDVPGHTNYDQRILKMGVLDKWKVSFWLVSFLHDDIDHKLFVFDKTREVYWPAPQMEKRSRRDELHIMPDARRAQSVGVNDRKKMVSLDNTQMTVSHLRRTKSVGSIHNESERWCIRDEDVAVEEADIDFYIRIMECERQDDLDIDGINFYYTF